MKPPELVIPQKVILDKLSAFALGVVDDTPEATNGAIDKALGLLREIQKFVKDVDKVYEDHIDKAQKMVDELTSAKNKWIEPVAEYVQKIEKDIQSMAPIARTTWGTNVKKMDNGEVQFKSTPPALIVELDGLGFLGVLKSRFPEAYKKSPYKEMVDVKITVNKSMVKAGMKNGLLDKQFQEAVGLELKSEEKCYIKPKEVK